MPEESRPARRFEDRVVLVVGGARGMGAAQARACAAEGAFVIVADILEREGAATVANLGDRATFIPLDVTNESDWQTAIAAAIAAAGAPIDVLLHNAGIARFARIEDMTLDDYLAVLNVNLVGAFLAIRSVIPSMTDAKRGAIVLNSSLDGLASHAMFASYCSAKSGMLALVRVAAIELAARGIRVNAVTPGAIDTLLLRPEGTPKSFLEPFASQIPLGRVGEPLDVAAAALFLASDDAGYITGTTLNVDGGVMAQVPLFVSEQ